MCCGSQCAQIIALVDIQPPASKADFNDVYEITELMDTDLHQIIRSNQPLTDEHFRYFMYQVRVSPGSEQISGSVVTV